MAFLLLLSPIQVIAEEDLNIRSWIVEADLLEDGALSIVKDISYDFNSDFNGVFVDISLDNIMEIDNLRIYEILSDQEIEYMHDQGAEIGHGEVFSTDSNRDSTRIMIFSPSEDENKTFRLTYRLYDVAAVHSDTGELNYKFIGDNNATPIDYFKANINLPQFNQGDIKIFGHGPSNGNIYFDNQSISLEAENIPSGQFVEARLLFPLDYIPTATRAGNSSLNDILDEERAFEEDIIQDELKRQERKTIFNNISIGLTAVGVLILGFLLRVFKRDPDLFDEMRSIYPDEISPAELSLFMNMTVGPRAYIASLLNLARKEYISFDKSESNKKPSKWDKSQDTSNYLFVRNDYPYASLMEHERFLLDWLFNDIGDGQRLSTDDIDFYRKKNPGKFAKSQSAWFKIVSEELQSRDYHDPRGKLYGISILIIAFILMIISVISLINEGLYGIPLLIIGVSLLVYSIFLFQRKSDKGYIQHRLWKDFKKNNSNIDIEDMGLSTDLSMIYLIALGLPMKDLDTYRQSIGRDYYPLHWGYLYFLTNSRGGSAFEDKFNNSFYGSSGTSSSSSSFGGGGGFTGGGGGGIGGSGSGGF